MGVKYNPGVVTSGLVFCFDAGNIKSYPKSGTGCYDLSNGDTGTLINGPTYDSTNGGSLVFDGTNDYVQFPSKTNRNVGGTDFSVFIWMKSNNKAGYQSLLTLDNIGWGGGIILYSLVDTGVFRTWVGNTAQNGNIDICNNSWNYVGIVRRSGVVTQYVNNIPDVTFNASGTTLSDQYVRLGSVDTTTYFLNGRISNGTMHNRALSDQEVSQNFNALRGRYGI